MNTQSFARQMTGSDALSAAEKKQIQEQQQVQASNEFEIIVS